MLPDTGSIADSSSSDSVLVLEMPAGACKRVARSSPLPSMRSTAAMTQASSSSTGSQTSRPLDARAEVAIAAGDGAEDFTGDATAAKASCGLIGGVMSP